MNWYYVSKGQRVGPLKEKEMRGLVQRNEIGRDTKIWRKGMANWEAAEEIAPAWFAAGNTLAVAQAGQSISNGRPTATPANGNIPNGMRPLSGANGAQRPTPASSTPNPLGANGSVHQMMMCSACGAMEHRERMAEQNGAYLCASCAAERQEGSHRRHHRRPVHQGRVKSAGELWSRLMEDHFRELLLLGGTLFCIMGMLVSWRTGVMLDFPLRTAASTCYLLVALACGAFDSKYGKTVLMGLFCCWFGSLALGILGGGPLVVGLGAYLAGHCAFIVAFWLRGVPTAWRKQGLRIFLVMAAALSIGGGFMCVQAFYRPFVVGYALISTATFVTALGARKGGSIGMLTYVGACTLLVADVAILYVRFVKPGFLIPMVGLFAYYGALNMLAFSTAYEFESANPARGTRSS